MNYTTAININASAATVWQVLTARMHQWLMDKEVVVDTDWQVGSAIIFSGELHGQPYCDKGVVLIVEPPKKLAYRYLSAASKLDDVESNYAIISFDIKEENGSTLLSITHSYIHNEIAYNHVKFYWPVALNVIKAMAEE